MTAPVKKKVLIVDDNHDILDLLEVFLFGKYDCVTALNGFEGLKTARELAPDLIITDIMMPVMDGIKFLNSLREDHSMAAVPVIAITSFVKKTNVKSLMSVGFSAVLTKPFSRDVIIGTIEKTLKKQ
jgi:CheY-like chemotaxis protein